MHDPWNHGKIMHKKRWVSKWKMLNFVCSILVWYAFDKKNENNCQLEMLKNDNFAHGKNIHDAWNMVNHGRNIFKNFVFTQQNRISASMLLRNKVISRRNTSYFCIFNTYLLPHAWFMDDAWNMVKTWKIF